MGTDCRHTNASTANRRNRRYDFFIFVIIAMGNFCNQALSAYLEEQRGKGMITTLESTAPTLLKAFLREQYCYS